MVELTRQLYNPSTTLQNLLNLPLPAASDAPARSLKPLVRQRRLGDVRDAMIAVLREEGGPLKTAEIYDRVGQKLEAPIGYQHVKNFLNHRSRGERQLFERVGFGRYRLLDQF